MFLVVVVVFGCFWLGSGVFGCGFLNGFAPVGFKSAAWVSDWWLRFVVRWLGW